MPKALSVKRNCGPDPFMDMFNSEILSYRISEKPNALAVMEGLEEAIQTTNDCPYRHVRFHSDQVGRIK